MENNKNNDYYLVKMLYHIILYLGVLKNSSYRRLCKKLKMSYCINRFANISHRMMLVLFSRESLFMK